MSQELALSQHPLGVEMNLCVGAVCVPDSQPIRLKILEVLAKSPTTSLYPILLYLSDICVQV